MKYLSTWATDAEILATANLLQIDILVYSRYGPKNEAYQRFPASILLSDKCTKKQLSLIIYLEIITKSYYDKIPKFIPQNCCGQFLMAFKYITS